MTYLIKTTKELHEWQTADSLTKDYYQSLKGMKRKKLYNKDIIVFIAANIETDHNPLFFFCSPDSKKVNVVMKRIDWQRTWLVNN